MKLADAAEHLLGDHDCDGHGHEEIGPHPDRAAIEAEAYKWRTLIRAYIDACDKFGAFDIGGPKSVRDDWAKRRNEVMQQLRAAAEAGGVA